MQIRCCLGLALVLGFVWLAPRALAQKSSIAAEQLVERRVINFDAQGFEQVRFEKAELVKPGDYLRYSIHYHNPMDAVAEDIVLTMPVPDVMDLIPGSVAPVSRRYQLSYDGGETFISPEGNDGNDLGSVTHIRWSFDSPIAPGEAGSVSMDVLLK